MSRIYNRNIRREIRHSFGRFTAIIAIVALGVGFLVGITSSTPDMKTTVSQYYKDQSMSDYDIKSSSGFTDDDINALEAIPEIQEVMVASVTDTLTYINNDEQTAGRIYGLDMDDITVNKLELIQGRMPENSTECVIENPTSYMEEVSIGDTITISDENKYKDTIYAQTEFVVVGIVENPYYFCNTREPASAGTGRTGVILYTYRDAYKAQSYTDLFLLTDNTYDAFSEEYDDYIDKVTEKIKSASDESDQWYILDRNSNTSYARFSVDVEKVADIATVFPIFFFLIAALVSLTTMTRMVEEERIQIGTMKALGYRRITIISKYLIYCGTATILGCIIGLLMGYRLLPAILFMCFGSQYTLPPLITHFYIELAVISCILELFCTLGATWAVCRHSLKEKTAKLMTPRSPKAGKRIMLERVGVLWNRISFSHKATFRNIFRYKKHMLMTIIGVAGCTALMVAGLGIHDSLTKLVNTQYDDILKYDMKIDLSENNSDQVLNDFLEDKDYLSIMTCSMDIESSENDEVISATVYVPSEPEHLQDFVSLRDRKSGDIVNFRDDSVVITEKMADILNVTAGDTVILTDSDGTSTTFTLTGITENYAGCYVYIAPDIYSSEFVSTSDATDDTGSTVPDWNSYLVKSGLTDTDSQESAAQHLQESECVSSTEFTSQSRETYENIMDSLKLLVSVLILFAGMLAAVVLYNLTNININERTRELATLRVLGYHHKEVGAYIFREIGILTIMGTVIGMLLGKVLHYYIIRIAESPDIVFGREITPFSYILAALFTLLFSALVDIIMSFKLKRIEMAASMKAID